MNEYQLQGIPYRILRSDRKTLSVYFRAGEYIEVRAPLHITDAFVLDFLTRKKAIILRKYNASLQRQEHKKDYSDGSKILLLGKEMELRYVEDAPFTWKQTDQLLVAAIYQDGIKMVLEHFYQRKADFHILNRAMALAELHGYHPTKLRISKNKRVWGFCNRKNGISFNAKLVMAPPAVIDYVILHELAHIDHKDHSKSFWDKVEKLMPGYAEHLMWLRVHGHNMSI
ncbi:MAG: SprT family zinc-dependent metalloprotease [Candidatus Cloacimonadaceae bacterium]|nr:SprT family zinc-dependent metalloprotease [Candidatus Cloacimonadaceae bacterium]